MKRLLLCGLGMFGLASAAVVKAAPAPCSDDGPSPAELTEQVRRTDLTGAALANEAIRQVASQYRYYSAWHLWESAAVSLKHRHGWSHQYNTVLAEVLTRLGFRTKLVHTAWVVGAKRPWWHNGHTWVKVRVDGRWHDACASRATHRLDDLPYTPAGEELPQSIRTRIAVPLWLGPFVVLSVWRSWLKGKPVSQWIYHRREE